MDIEKILIIKLRHGGDVLLTVPAIRALKERFPEASLSVLLYEGTEGMLDGNPLVDSILTFPRDVSTYSPLRRLSFEWYFIKQIRGLAFDLTVDLTGDLRGGRYSYYSRAAHRLGPEAGPSSGGVGILGGGLLGRFISMLPGPEKGLYSATSPRPAPGTHTVLRDLSLLHSVGLDTSDLTIDLYISPDDEAEAEELLKEGGLSGSLNPDNPDSGERVVRRFVHMDPFSGPGHMQWRDEYLREIISKVLESGVSVVLTAAEGAPDAERVRGITGEPGPEPGPEPGGGPEVGHSEPGCGILDLTDHQLTPKVLGAVLKRASLFFGIDSAAMHIGAAVGTPVVALFGPNGAFDWGPWDNDECNGWLKDLKKGGIADGGLISPYGGLKGTQSFGKHLVIQSERDCVPCGRAGCEGSGISDCIVDDITPEMVWEAMEPRLAL